MSETRDLFNSEESLKRRDEAMKSIDRHADNEEPEWKREAFACIVDLAGRCAGGFTSDSVWLVVDKPTDVDPRALGPIFNHAQRAGLIVATAEFRISESVTRHGAPLRVWKGRQWK